MKKIYILTAVFALLTLSLNAQVMRLTKAPNRAVTTYEKITSTSDLTDGEYLIVCEAQSRVYNGALAESALKGTYNSISVTISNNTIASSSAVDAATFTYNSSEQSLKSASGYYIYRATGTSGGSVATSPSVPTTVNVISFSSGNASIKCEGASTYYLKYNSNNECFRYYTSGQTVVQLYKKVTSSSTTPTLISPVNGDNVDLGVNTGSGVSKTINVRGSDLTEALSVSVSGTGFHVSTNSVSAADANASAGKDITVTYNGTATNATGQLIISSNEVSATVDLTASYSTPNIYEKVTSASQLVAGKQYILVYEGGPAVMGAITTSGTLYGTSVSGATLSGNEIDVAGATGVSELTLGGSAGAWTFTADGTNYLNYTGSSNTLSTSTDNTANDAKWTATSSDGGYILTNVGNSNRVLQYNTSYTRFACYTTTQQPAFLYVKKSTTPELTSIANGDVINVGTHSGNGVSKTVNIKGNNLTQDLTVNVSGTGFSISRAVTVTAAEANSANGQDVIVTYNGTDANATGTLTVQSSEIGTVTAQLTASYGSTPSGETGTVGNGATSDFYLPAYGSYQDYGYKNQMIYTADKLAEAGIQAGDQITSITFYPTTASGYNGGIDFYGSTVTLSLGNTEVGSFSGSKITPSDLTDVVTITPVRDNNATEWTFSWSTPFTYTGENLLVQVYCPGYEHDGTNGDYGRTYFKGDNQSSNVGLYSYNSSSYSTSGTSGTSGTNRQFLPQATFTYLTNTNPVLTAPQDGDNVSFGPYEAPATNASTTITVKGRNLTEALSVSVSGTGFHVLTNSVSAADANAGTTITVTYDGTDPTATGTLTITSGNGEVSTVTVNLTSGYISHDPVLTAPTSGTTIDVGTNTGAGTSTTITVSGNYLTQDLNVSVDNSDFSVSPTSISAADAMAGTTITVTYTGTDPNATATLTIGSGEVSATVNLTASYEYNPPVLTTSPTDGSYLNMVVNQGSSTTQTITVSGEYLTEGLTVSVTGDGFSVSPTTISAADANNGSVTVTVTYDGSKPISSGTLTIGSSEVSDATIHLIASTPGGSTNLDTHGIIRMGNLIIVDQFNESTAKNDHPKTYKYVLKYEPEDKSSSPVEVDVEQTNSIVYGYYTADDVKNDSAVYNTVIVNKLAADVEMNLPDNDNEIYYVRLQSKKDDVPQAADKVKDNFDMLAKLQLISGEGGFYYSDALPESHPQSDPGEYHYTDKSAETGVYAVDYKTYVPSIMTYGFDRHYFADDTLHNTYGAPIWKTGVGQVNVHSAIVERQIGKYGSANWEAPGTVAGSPDQVDPNNTVPASLVLLHNVQADGFLPSMRVSNVEYVPYKFHVYVYSASGKLRGYIERAAGEDGMSGTHVINDDNFTNYTGPICIYSKDVSEETVETLPDENNDGKGVTLVIPLKQQGSTEWEGYPSFGALDSAIPGDGQQINENDLQIFIRFYYKSAGNESPSEMRGAGDVPEAQMYYGSEGKFNPSGWTALNEIVNSGHVVGVTYVNPQGMQSDRPFEGLNIEITRYSDGRVTTTKVIK